MCMIVADESLRADMLTIMTDDNVDRGLQRFRERDKESGSADSPVSGSPVPAPRTRQRNGDAAPAVSS